ncbi:hypothetical protein MNBD_GAMMA18-705 [hydrothermal vent metagenome]|uniref:Uncharacterized protein n=1 Tax=hydrothermal vent metagenome TaxID=652676 RepID=A0A3B0Z352_9ZZZZ
MNSTSLSLDVFIHRVPVCLTINPDVINVLSVLEFSYLGIRGKQQG